jgi:hypothetical protein
MSTGGAGGGSSAAMTLASAVVNVMADTKALHQQLNLVQSHLAGLQNSMNRGTDPSTAQQNLAGLGGSFSSMIEAVLFSFRGGIQSILGMLTGGALMAAMAGIVSTSVGMAGQFEQSVQSFEALTGSAEEAKAILEEINQFAAATPFQTPELEAAVKASMLYGFSAKEAMKQVKMLGDISAISGAEISELTRMYAQMKSMGPNASVGSDFLGMLMNRGVLSRKDIAEELGISEVALADRISKGMLKWKQIEPMFLKLTAEGGRFYRGLERQAGTLPGLISTLMDNITLIRRTIGEIFIEGAKYYTQIGIQIAGTILKWSQALVEFNKNSGGMVARLASALAISFTLIAVVPRLVTAIKMLATTMNLSLASTGWGALIVAVGGLIYLILSVASSMRKVGESSGVLTRIGKLASDLYAKLVTAFSGVGEQLMAAFSPIAEMIEGALASAVNFVSENMDTIVGIIQAGVLIVSTVIRVWSTVVVAEFRVAVAVFMALANAIGRVFGSETGDVLSKGLEFFLGYVETMATLIIWLSNKFMWFIDAVEYVSVTFVDMTSNMSSAFREMFDGITRMAVAWAKGIREILKGALTGNIGGAMQSLAEEIQRELSFTMNRITDAATRESDAAYAARIRLTESERDERSMVEILSDIQSDRKYGAFQGSGASGVMQFASDLVGDKDKKDEPGSGGGMLMRAGFVGLDSAVKDMQQILLDEMKGDQQLGVLKDIRDVQRQTLEAQRQGLAMGVEEKPAIIGE